MGDIPVDGMTRVAWVSSVADIAAPTTDELNAGLLLQETLTADGLMGFEPETADVPATSLASTFDTVDVGRDSFSNTALRFKKQTGTDTIYNTLTRLTAGYVVIRRDVGEGTAWATAQPVEVFPVRCGQTRRLAPESNSMTRYEVTVKITSSPELRAAVA